MKILVAPDSFKDALDAAGACAAMAAGVRAGLPEAEVEVCPLADGGEGTGAVLAEAIGAQRQTALILDPLGRERSARWWISPGRDTALIEMAEASGLWLLARGERRATETTSYGTGQLIRAAVEAGVSKVILCVGGSATVDGGAGCLQALGWELVGEAGRVLGLPACGKLLAQVRGLRPPRELLRVGIEVLVDVDNALVGPRGAAPVFGPQKGASTGQVALLAEGLVRWADVLATTTGRDVRDQAGSGAAGGLPAGLAAALGARLSPGFDGVAERLDLDGKLRGCGLCLTGEGRLDEQTLAGKVVAGVARRARAADVPVVVFAGAVQAGPGRNQADLARALGVTRIIIVTPPGTRAEQALAQTGENLGRAVAEYVAGQGRNALSGSGSAL